MKTYEKNQILLKEIQQTDKLRTIATLASGMAHEIKNPLTPIRTFAEQLPHRINDKEFLLKFSDIIIKEVDRIDSLVHELLDFAKPSPPNLSKTNITQLINSTLDFLNNEIIKHHIIVCREYIISPETQIHIDPKQIKQALLNIILNAIEAMKHGGQLSVYLDINDHYLVVRIQDTGIGIDPKDLPYIFDPFYSKKDNGTGLGLSITHEIINNHGGTITAQSELNQGTSFTIKLPID